MESAAITTVLVLSAWVIFELIQSYREARKRLDEKINKLD